MTKVQFNKKVDVARTTGQATMPDRCLLIYRGNNVFAVYDKGGFCVQVSKRGASDLFYLFDN